MTNSYEKIAKILRADKDVMHLLEEKMNKETGKTGIFDKIVEENKTAVDERLAALGLTRESSAKEVFDALINKARNDDKILFEALGKPKPDSQDDWNKILGTIKELQGVPKGFFLKKEKAIEFLKNTPPVKVIESLGYSSVDELIAKEDLFEIFSSLRFIQGAEWINSEFLKQYENLKDSDFEEREITAIALSPKWSVLAQDFIKHKYHNISHLKEMGLIYVIPASLDIAGETLRNFSLIFHYFNEVKFYSRLMKEFSQNETTFAKNLVSLFRGDVLDYRLPVSEKAQWMVVQRYLSKDDENDWRLFEPHINPESLHWERGERQIIELIKKIDGSNLDFWQNLSWVGDFFKDDTGTDVLISFDLVDATMELAQEKQRTKMYYHHQESLWNKIFVEYVGEQKMEDYMRDYILSGRFEI